MEWSFVGRSPEVEAPSLSAVEWQAVQQTHEQQLFDLANSIRTRNNLPTLLWNEEAARVGRSHSLDMLQNHFFDHRSPTTGLDPFERLSEGGVSFRRAGENIAAGHRDAIEAHEAWMNSKGHRENVLRKEFTTLGVGVVQNLYSQEFVTP